jgi:hypothetical protein
MNEALEKMVHIQFYRTKYRKFGFGVKNDKFRFLI